MIILLVAISIFFYVWIGSSHNGYVIRVRPETERQHNLLSALHSEDFFEIKFVNETMINGTTAIDLMISEGSLEQIENLLEQFGATYEIVEAIDEEITFPEKIDAFILGHHNSYNTIVKWMEELTLTYSGLVETFTMGKTHESRDIVGIRIGMTPSDTPKRAVWIDGGIHGREWAAVHAVTFFIHQLLCQYGIDQQMTKYVDQLEFYIVPVVNPDGYEYTRSAIDNRLWRKNRSARKCNETGYCCQGVDLNRNFDVFFGENGASDNPCSKFYAGEGPFSEPETQAVRDFMFSDQLKGRVDAFVTMHAFGQTKSLGSKVAEAIANVKGSQFKSGKASEIMYVFSGSHDWAGLVAGVTYAYCIEMPPLFTPQNKDVGFMLAKSELIPTAKEIWEGVKVVVEAAMKKG
ncbi:hypothetical protein QR680_010215 [Steinernema hermaphroditum]|uniref:Peptidase M14 domain-containing protein n=1 Tax=Steinernema hermaphroditum TaxID=289476 RepID=A0AA39IPE3_9BILA|nr:hypothetical protein QR680_010215 [Steinernema hermaphroditum]